MIVAGFEYRAHLRWQTARAAAVALAVFLLLPASLTAQAAGDVDCDGHVTANDPLALVRALFETFADCVAPDVNGDRTATAADLAAVSQWLDTVPGAGPRISYLGLAGASGLPISELGRIGATPVYFRNAGSGFRVVVEAAAGANGSRPGRSTARLDDPTLRPDLQFVCNRNLGDGNPTVCDGGIPAVAAPHVDAREETTLAINDIGCPFESFTAPNFSCTLDSFNNPNFLSPDTRVQFCVLVARPFEFPEGDTLCSVQVRDVSGVLGPLASMIVRVGSDTNPPTFTPTVPPTPTATRFTPATRTRTATPTWTNPPPSTPTRTFTQSATPTPTLRPTTPPITAGPTTPPATAVPSATRTVSASATQSPSPTGTAPRTPTVTPTGTAPPPPTTTRTRTATPTPPRTATPTQTATSTPSATRTRTPTRTPTATQTATTTPTTTRTRTPTATPTRTPTGPRGPIVSYFGLARADDNLVDPSGTTAAGVPIFTRANGTGFSIVVEARPGASGVDSGQLAYDFGGTSFPDLQMLASRPLGNGSAAVCDRTQPDAGGVPATDPPVFAGTAAVVGATNDLGCRFLDGNNNPFGRRGADNSCVQVPFDSGTFRFVGAASTIQFCGLVDSAFAFPTGDTLLTVRLRDLLGNLGEPSQIVVRVQP